MSDTSPVTSREFDAANRHINGQLAQIRKAIDRIETNSVTTARYDSGMHRVKDLQASLKSQADKQDDQIDVVKTSVALLGQTVDTYRKFVWVMIGAVVSLTGSLVFWLVAK